MKAERLKHSTNPDIYKQIYYKDISGPNKYTTAFVTESDYMNTRVWRELRSKVLERDNHKCKHCRSGINIEIHHIRYPEVWGEEDLDDLVALCRKCHEKVHADDKKGDIK